MMNTNCLVFVWFFFLRMDPVLGCRLGLHDENMLREVITIQNYCYALAFRQIIFVN